MESTSHIFFPLPGDVFLLIFIRGHWILTSSQLIYAAAELGRNLVSKHQIQPEHGDEQADAGRDCRTRLAKPNSQPPTRTGKYSFFLFS